MVTTYPPRGAAILSLVLSRYFPILRSYRQIRGAVTWPPERRG